LACRIHEGTVFSNRDKRTLPDKMILLLDSLGLLAPFYFVADAYYANGKTVRELLAKGRLPVRGHQRCRYPRCLASATTH
jgi:3-deoxy-D-manno-octulosonic-acid transferase